MIRKIDVGRPSIEIFDAPRNKNQRDQYPFAKIFFHKKNIKATVTFQLSQDILFECYDHKDNFLMRHSFSFGDWFYKQCSAMLPPHEQEDMSLDMFEVGIIKGPRNGQATGFAIQLQKYPQGKKTILTVDIRDRETVISGFIGSTHMARYILPYDRIFSRIMSDG